MNDSHSPEELLANTRITKPTNNQDGIVNDDLGMGEGRLCDCYGTFTDNDPDQLISSVIRVQKLPDSDTPPAAPADTDLDKWSKWAARIQWFMDDSIEVSTTQPAAGQDYEWEVADYALMIECEQSPTGNNTRIWFGAIWAVGGDPEKMYIEDSKTSFKAKCGTCTSSASGSRHSASAGPELVVQPTRTFDGWWEYSIPAQNPVNGVVLGDGSGGRLHTGRIEVFAGEVDWSFSRPRKTSIYRPIGPALNAVRMGWRFGDVPEACITIWQPGLLGAKNAIAAEAEGNVSRLIGTADKFALSDSSADIYVQVNYPTASWFKGWRSGGFTLWLQFE